VDLPGTPVKDFCMPLGLKRLLLLILLSACTAATLRLWLSADPAYELQQFIHRSDYKAYDRLIVGVAEKHRIPPELLKAIIWQESRFRPGKVGTSGERGLMQVGESAATDWARAEKITGFLPTDLLDPRTNVLAGGWYFARALDHWKNRDNPLPFALAEYNAGKVRVDRWIAASGLGDQAAAADLMDAIDFPGTRRYIEGILDRYQFYLARGWM
jgi:soluble lytic murein transglycosylase